MSQFHAISLFTGAGGLDYGFEAAGFDTKVAVEFDPVCVSTLKRSRHWPVLAVDLAKLASEDLLRSAGLKVSEADILIGGPPCQPFSKSGFWVHGASRRLDDPRSRTLRQYLRVLADTLPRTFLLENVEGFGFRGQDEGIDLIARSLRRINSKRGTSYSVSIAVLNAAAYGVPQTRKRVFIVGARDGTSFQFPAPTHADSRECEAPGSRLRKYVTAWDAIHDLPRPEDPFLAPRGKWARLLASIPEGENYLWHTERGGGTPLFGWRRRYWSFLLKLAKDRPAWTLQAQPGPATGPFHWENRKLSIAEMIQLQTFPRDVAIAGTYRDAVRQLGNAVPSLLGEILAREIARQLLGRRPYSTKLKLGVAEALVAPPPPGPTSKVPAEFLADSSRDSPHPGTGLGRRALSRRVTTLAP